MKKLRKIHLGRLWASGLVYRAHVILVHIVVLWSFTGEWEWSVGTALELNGLNLVLYYNYHYWFSRLFKMGED